MTVELYKEICTVWKGMYGPNYHAKHTIGFNDFELIARHFYNKAAGEGPVCIYDIIGPPNEDK
ncbi:MAG: hypothetical protein IKZ39_02800 [Lachnospiraceae bacterium]|nr:hypothetical protein [Lachnospiraceae bacterium]